MNYHMNKIDSTLFELLNILVIAEGILKSSKIMVLIVEQASFKRKSIRNKKNKMPVKKQKTEIKKKKKALKKASDKEKYFYCNVEGH